MRKTDLCEFYQPQQHRDQRRPVGRTSRCCNRRPAQPAQRRILEILEQLDALLFKLPSALSEHVVVVQHHHDEKLELVLEVDLGRRDHRLLRNLRCARVSLKELGDGCPGLFFERLRLYRPRVVKRRLARSEEATAVGGSHDGLATALEGGRTSHHAGGRVRKEWMGKIDEVREGAARGWGRTPESRQRPSPSERRRAGQARSQEASTVSQMLFMGARVRQGGGRGCWVRVLVSSSNIRFPSLVPSP